MDEIKAFELNTFEHSKIVPLFLFSKGIALVYHKEKGKVYIHGGKSFLGLEIELSDFKNQDKIIKLIKETEERFSIQLIGVPSSSKNHTWDLAVSNNNKIIEPRWLREEMLSDFTSLEYSVLQFLFGTENIELHQAFEGVLPTGIAECGLTGGSLEMLEFTYDIACKILGKEYVDIMISYYDVCACADDIRSNLDRAIFEFNMVNSLIYTILIRRYPMQEEKKKLCSKYDINEGEWEIIAYDESIDEVGYHFTNAIISLRSVLDILTNYLIAIFSLEKYDNKIIKIPKSDFGQIEKIKIPEGFKYDKIHETIFNNVFSPLSRLRNDFVHNMACDRPRTRFYIGRSLPPVNSEPIAYVDYRTRDFFEEGRPAQWNNRNNFDILAIQAQHFLKKVFLEVMTRTNETIKMLCKYANYLKNISSREPINLQIKSQKIKELTSNDRLKKIKQKLDERRKHQKKEFI